MTAAELKGDVVILACAVSAGIHGALVPGHGLPFAAATAVLAGLVVWLTLRPGSRPALAAAALTLGGLLGAYALGRSRPGSRCSTPTRSRSTASRSPRRRSRLPACSAR